MPDETVNLSLPYILPAQAQKHVTHNEALQRLDAIVQLAITATTGTPPDDAAEGSRYLISLPASGPWTGKSGKIAFRQDGSWIYLTPLDGWHAWFLDDQRLRVRSEGTWQDLPLPPDAEFMTLGINTAADTINRLALSAPASLFNHAGHGHQIKLNKAGSTETASLLFQSAWSGRAEIGLTGNDDLSFKVSADGATWMTALAISPDGVISAPHRPLVRASLSVGTATPASGSMTGFDDLHVVQGGFALGAAIAGGAGHELIVPKTGIYQLSLSSSLLSSSSHSASIIVNGGTILATSAAASTSGAFRQTALTLAALTAGDRLAIKHTGTAQYDFGSGKTEIFALWI